MRDATGRGRADRERKLKQLKSLQSELRSIVLDVQNTMIGADFDPKTGVDFYDAVNKYQIHLIESALVVAHGKQKHAAELLKMQRSTLCTKIKQFKIDPRAY